MPTGSQKLLQGRMSNIVHGENGKIRQLNKNQAKTKVEVVMKEDALAKFHDPNDTIIREFWKFPLSMQVECDRKKKWQGRQRSIKIWKEK